MKQQITIIEDDEITALNLKINIEKLGYGVSGVFHTPAEALDALGHIKSDLFFIDISLQDSDDGLKLAETLKEKTGKPFIFLTAHSDEAVVAKAKVLEPNGYIVKPFHPNSLKASLQMALPLQESADNATDIASLPKDAVERRLQLLAKDDGVTFAHLYHYDTTLDQFFKNNFPLELKEEQKEVLKLLLANLGVVVTLEEIQNYFRNKYNKAIKAGRVLMHLKMALGGSDVVKSAEGIGYYIEE